MQQTHLIIDSHIHIYDCYNLEQFFQKALQNFDRLAPPAPEPGMPTAKILMLTEGKQLDFFSHFKESGHLPGSSQYRFLPAGDALALTTADDDSPLCYLLPGRQIVTRENLEVLLLASSLKIEDRLPIQTVLETIAKNNDIAALAWGVAKWLFKRGNIINNLVDQHETGSEYSNLLIGDNSGRPIFWPAPKSFKKAAQKQIPIINGSDPLPFPPEISKPGTYGFTTQAPFDPQKPNHSIKELLLSPNARFFNFGKQDGILSFFIRQSRIYLKKYLKRQ